MTGPRLPVRARTILVGLVVLSGGHGARDAIADAGVVVAVDCPLLGAEPEAALEARARAELMVRPASGTLVVFCRTVASLTWHPVGGQSSEANVPLSGDPSTDIERILEALDPLLTLRTSPEASTGSAEPPVAPVAPVAAPVLPASSAVLSAPVEDRQPPLAHGSVALGALGELWSQRATGALGPRLRLQLDLPGRLSIDGGGAAMWALKAPDGVGARLFCVQLGGAYSLDHPRRLRVGVDVSLDFLHATRAAPLQTSVANKSLVGAVLHVSYVVVPGPVRLVLGPTLALHLGKTLVELGSREVFHIPAAVVGFAAEVEFGLN